MRRGDLSMIHHSTFVLTLTDSTFTVIPYKAPTEEIGDGGDVASTMSTTLPMVAVSIYNIWPLVNYQYP